MTAPRRAPQQSEPPVSSSLADPARHVCSIALTGGSGAPASGGARDRARLSNPGQPPSAFRDDRSVRRTISWSTELLRVRGRSVGKETPNVQTRSEVDGARLGRRSRRDSSVCPGPGRRGAVPYPHRELTLRLAVRFEARTVRPDRTAVWTNGYWDRQGDQWAWSSGRWQQPLAPRARWVKARYKREGCPWYRRQNCSWRYEPAHWSNQQLVEGEDYQAYRKARNSGRNRR